MIVRRKRRLKDESDRKWFGYLCGNIWPAKTCGEGVLVHAIPFKYMNPATHGQIHRHRLFYYVSGAMRCTGWHETPEEAEAAYNAGERVETEDGE